jgi:hypothetical protein
MICEAILEIKSDAQVSVSGMDIDTCIIEWVDDNPTNITREQIKDKINETQYQRDRKPEYPSMADQLDYIYHNGIDKWKSDMVKPVKDAHPKP